MTTKTTRRKARPPRGIPFEATLARDMRDPAFRKAWERESLIHAVALAVRELREEAGLTQAELASMIGTKQSVIARLESGRDQRTPRFDLLDRIAVATGRRLKIVFARRKDAGPRVEIAS